MQPKLKEFLDQTGELIAKEQHSKALCELRECGLGLLQVPCTPDERKYLLLRICDIYYNNQHYAEATGFLNTLDKEYSDAGDDVNFIALKSQVLIKTGDVRKALEILDEAIHRDCPDEQHYALSYYFGKAHFWNGDYATGSGG